MIPEWILAIGTAIGVGSVGAVAYALRSRPKAAAEEDAALPRIIHLWDPEKLPVTVLPIAERAADVAVRQHLRWAMQWWCDNVGVRLFVPLGSHGSGCIVPVVDERRHEGSAIKATTKLNARGAIISAQVRADTGQLVGMPADAVRRLLVHELGHLLGLEHDDARDSVMYPHVGPAGEYEVSTADRVLLREMYGGG